MSYLKYAAARRRGSMVRPYHFFVKTQ